MEGKRMKYRKRQTNRGSEPPILQKHWNNDMMMILCVKFHYNLTWTSLKTFLTKNLNLSRMAGKLMNKQMNGGSESPFDRKFATLICWLYVVFSFIRILHELHLKLKLTKNLNLSRMEGKRKKRQKSRQTNRWSKPPI